MPPMSLPTGDPVGATGSDRRRWWMNKWLQPAALAWCWGPSLGAAYWAGGDPVTGAIGFAILAAFGLVLLIGGRSDTVRGMRGDGRDERWAMIDMRATALAGFVVITAIIVGFIVETAHGHDGDPYTWLGALAGVAYLVGASHRAVALVGQRVSGGATLHLDRSEATVGGRWWFRATDLRLRNGVLFVHVLCLVMCSGPEQGVRPAGLVGRPAYDRVEAPGFPSALRRLRTGPGPPSPTRGRACATRSGG